MIIMEEIFKRRKKQLIEEKNILSFIINRINSNYLDDFLLENPHKREITYEL